MRKDAHRLNLELGPKTAEALSYLQEAIDAPSQAETIRVALQTCTRLAREAARGGSILVKRKDGEVLKIMLVFS